MKYFESHAHPDHPLIEDKNKYVQEMRNSEIEKMIIAPITYESNYSSLELFPEAEYPDIYFAKGLHPKYTMNTAMWSKKQIQEFRELLLNHRVVALKTGLDLCKKKVQDQQIQRQYEFLKLFMLLAGEYKKPLVLHIREAADEAIQFLSENPLAVPAEVHCFTYNKEVMQKFIDVGITFFGIGGMVTRSENVELQEAVMMMPLEMILLESDAPFVKVEGEKEKINTSTRALPAVASKIAELKGIDVEEVVEATYRNACRFFGIEDA